MCHGEVSVLLLRPGVAGGILLRDHLSSVRVGCCGARGLSAYKLLAVVCGLFLVMGGELVLRLCVHRVLVWYL